MIGFRAIQDRIVVKRIEEETVVNGLFVPDLAKEKPAQGEVVAVGPGKYVNGDLQTVSVRVGDRVLFGKFSGAEIKVGIQDYLILREEDIFIVFNKQEN